jgi:drug/metabolite transporter (DMT)-like permease
MRRRTISHFRKPPKIMNTPSNTARRASLLLVLAFAAVYIIWGTTYLAIRYGLLGIPPFMLITLRYILAAILLFAWCFVARLRFPNRQNTRILSISGLLLLVGGIGSVVLGEQYINSGSTAVITATAPLLFLLLDRNNWKTYTPRKLGGLLLGFFGVFLFSRLSGAGEQLSGAHRWDTLKGTALVFLSVIFWVSGTLYARKQKDNTASPVANTAIQHLAAAAACCFISIMKGEWQTFHPATVPTAAWIGLGYLVLMGSVVAFMAFMWLVKMQPPAIVSTYTYVNPAVAVFAGWIIAGERVGAAQIGALLLVLVGVLLVQSRLALPSITRRLFRRQPRCETGS